MKNIKTIALAAIAAMTAGCSDSGTEVPAYKDMKDMPVTFTADINTLTARAGHGAGTLSSGEFGLYFSTDGTSDSRYNATNTKVTGTDGTWTPEKTLLWKDNATKVKYTAYLPYNKNLAQDLYPIQLSATQTAETILNEDLLYTSATDITAESNPDGIALQFKHKLTQLKIVLTKANEVEEDTEVTGIKLESCVLTGNLNVPSGTLTAEASTADVNMYGSKSEGAAFTDTWEALLIPQDLTLKVTVSVGSGSDRRIFQYTSSSPVKLKEGTINTLSLTVGRDKVIVGSISAQEWKTGKGGVIEAE